MDASQADRHKTTSSDNFLANNSLSIALLSLFAVSLAAQAVFGWRGYDESLSASGYPTIGFWQFLGTGTFLNGMFSNWQAAILQLTVLIAFSTVLRQRGAAHSRKSGDEPHDAETPVKQGETTGGGKKPEPPTPESRRRITLNTSFNPLKENWLYDNSLSLAMLALFVLFFGLHAWTSSLAYNEEQGLRHLAKEPLKNYLTSSTFFFNTFQTWEAEFVCIAIYIILSIFLRQERSPESKKMGTSNKTSGDTNE